MASTPAPNLQRLRDGLAAIIKGPVLLPDDPLFVERSKTFNGKLKPNQRLVVSPLDAQDVSAIIRFCIANDLSPSVRAGGYGIAGWAVAGDIVVDMSLLREMSIEAPTEREDGTHTWTRLRDMIPPVVQEGGGAAQVPPARPAAERTKRRREDSPEDTSHPDNGLDSHLRNYAAASQSVASFLHGPALPAEDGEEPRRRPTNRRRTESSPFADHDVPHLSMPPLTARQASAGSSSSSSQGRSSNSGMGTDGRALSTSTGMSSPTDTPVDSADPQAASNDFVPSHGPSATRDPFGYMSSGPAAPPQAVYSGFRAFPSSAGPVNMFGHPVVMQPPNIFSSVPSPFPQYGLPGTLGHIGNMARAKPVHTHAYVTIGAGIKQKEVDVYTASHPLEGVSGVSGAVEQGLVPYHVPTAAHPVGSSIMILTGFGFLSRLHGLSIDNVVEMEMVLADGRIVVVSEEEHPELWWAIRGAGPAFGIITRYKVKAFPVPVVFAGNLIYRFHRATAPSLIKHFRDCIKGAPRELYANVLLTAGPADKDSLVVIQMCYLGPKEQGAAYLQAISSWDGERCLLNEVNEKSFLYQQDSIAQILRGKAGRQWFLRSSLIHSLPDEVIHKTVMQFADTPIGCTWIFELSGGAIADFEDTCLPKEQREATWTVAALHQWEMGIDDPRCITTAEDWMAETIKSVSVGGPFPAFLGRHESPARTMACYGKHWTRLATLKREYDPANVFKNNFWPVDKDGAPIALLDNEPPSPSMTPWQTSQS